MRKPLPEPCRNEKHCVKLPGQHLLAGDFDHQAAKLQVRIVVLNRLTTLGMLVTEALGYVRPRKEERRPPDDFVRQSLF